MTEATVVFLEEPVAGRPVAFLSGDRQGFTSSVVRVDRLGQNDYLVTTASGSRYRGYIHLNANNSVFQSTGIPEITQHLAPSSVQIPYNPSIQRAAGSQIKKCVRCAGEIPDLSHACPNCGLKGEYISQPTISRRSLQILLSIMILFVVSLTALIILNIRGRHASSETFIPQPFPHLSASVTSTSKTIPPANGVLSAPDNMRPSGNIVSTPSNAEFEPRLLQHGAGGGDVQISLAWNNINDIDIHCFTPSGEHIYFAEKRSTDGGILDVDMNVGSPFSTEPVENIFWATGSAPSGRYTVYVNHYNNNGALDPTTFSVRVVCMGNVNFYSGTINSGDPPFKVCEFDVR